MRRSARTGGITMLGAALLALLLPATAVATPPDDSGVVERTTTDEHWLWAGDGVFVLEGPPIEEGCFGEGFDDIPETVVHTPAGVTLISSTHRDDVWVFDDEGFDDPLEWLFGRACPALGTDDAAIPLATGEGLVSINGRFEPDGDARIRGRLNAQVTTQDGRTVHVHAHGDLDGLTDHVNYGG